MYKQILFILLSFVASIFTSCDEPTSMINAELYLYSEDAVVEVSYYVGTHSGEYVKKTTTIELSDTTILVGGMLDNLLSTFNKHPEYGIMILQIKEGSGYVIATPFTHLYINGEFTYIGNHRYSQKQIMEALAAQEGNAIKITDKEIHSIPGACSWDYSKGEKVNYGNGTLPEVEL